MIAKLLKNFCFVVFVDISLQTRTWSPTTQQRDRLCPWNFARLSSNIRQRGEPSFSSILNKMISKLLKHFCFVVFVDISRQTRTWSPTTQQPDVSANETLRAYRTIWDKVVSRVSAPHPPNRLQNCWNTSVLWCLLTFHCKQGHDPQQLNNQIVSAIKLCTPFK